MDQRPENRRELKLIRGGLYKNDEIDGPVTRLGLWDQFLPLTNKRLALIFIPKLLLLAMVLYFLLG